jgi:hypothetical protein
MMVDVTVPPTVMVSKMNVTVTEIVSASQVVGTAGASVVGRGPPMVMISVRVTGINVAVRKVEKPVSPFVTTAVEQGTKDVTVSTMVFVMVSPALPVTVVVGAGSLVWPHPPAQDVMVNVEVVRDVVVKVLPSEVMVAVTGQVVTVTNVVTASVVVVGFPGCPVP